MVNQMKIADCFIRKLQGMAFSQQNTLPFVTANLP
jgi:hypothetical protein